MTAQTFYHTLLLLHLVGLTLFAGTTIADFVTFKQFGKQYDHNKIQPLALLPAMASLQVLMRVGIAVIILAGIGLMAMTRGAYGEQLWFRIKFALVLLIIVNSIVVGNRQRIKLKKTFEANDPNTPAIVTAIRNKLNRFYYIQLTSLFAIVLLSVFKFN